MFIFNRWNAIKREKAKFSPQYPYLVPRTYANSFQEDSEDYKGQPIDGLHWQANSVKCQVNKKAFVASQC